MARETLVRLICDKSTDSNKHEAQSTMSFMYGGATYEADLCDKHAKDMDKVFEPLIGMSRRAARFARGQGSRTRRQVSSQPAYNEDAARTWAKLQGLNVKDEGRLSPTTIKAWRDAGSPGA